MKTLNYDYDYNYDFHYRPPDDHHVCWIDGWIGSSLQRGPSRPGGLEGGGFRRTPLHQEPVHGDQELGQGMGLTLQQDFTPSGVRQTWVN